MFAELSTPPSNKRVLGIKYYIPDAEVVAVDVFVIRDCLGVGTGRSLPAEGSLKLYKTGIIIHNHEI